MGNRWRFLLTVVALFGIAIVPAAVLADGPDRFEPATITATLRQGDSTTVATTLHFRWIAPKADIILAIDNTGSMSQPIAQAKREAGEIVTEVRNRVPEARFAVVSFRDYPISPYGGSGDSPYTLLTNGFTSDVNTIQSAVDTMFASGGNDRPEAYNRVFYEGYSDPVLKASRDPQAMQFLVVLGDNPPHDPTQTIAPACGDQPPVDPGPDGQPGTADDLQTETVLAGLHDDNIKLLMILYPNGFDNTSRLCYHQLAIAADGAEFVGGENKDLSQKVVIAVRSVSTHLDAVELRLNTGCPLQVTSDPASPLGPVDTPNNLSFSETVTAPPSLAPGDYTCTLKGVGDGVERAVQTIHITVIRPKPTVLTLSPKSAQNPVDSQHCVTATVKDQFDQPSPDIVVRFSVSGSVQRSDSPRTDSGGTTRLCYTGPELPGSDAISAFADTDGDGAKAVDEPGDTASKDWVLPAGTPSCTVTNAGKITAANGDKATFSGNAGTSATGAASGQEKYQYHGAAGLTQIRELSVLAVVCNPDRVHATVFGKASVGGAGSFYFRVDVGDLGESGVGRDTYRILVGNGYDSGLGTLEGGNVQVRGG
jgi:hypothetical protein